MLKIFPPLTGHTKYNSKNLITPCVPDESSVEITELPVKTWTQNYKEFLESLINGKENPKDKSGPKIGANSISDYKDYCTESRIRYVVKFPNGKALRDAEKSGIHKKGI